MAPALRMYVDMLERTMEVYGHTLIRLTSSDKAHLHAIGELLVQAAAIRERLSAAASAGVDGSLEFIRWYQQQLLAMRDGDTWVVPGGWRRSGGGHALLYIYQRHARRFSLVVCNTGGGVQYHPSTVQHYPKQKHRTALYIGDIPVSRITNSSFLYMLLKLQLVRRVVVVAAVAAVVVLHIAACLVSPHACAMPTSFLISQTRKEENCFDMVYEVLLPYLAGMPLAAAIARDAGKHGDFETIQRSGTCFLRSDRGTQPGWRLRLPPHTLFITVCGLVWSGVPLLPHDSY